jgi:WD40 repeat protein
MLKMPKKRKQTITYNGVDNGGDQEYWVNTYDMGDQRSLSSLAPIAAESGLDDYGIGMQFQTYAWSPDSKNILFPFPVNNKKGEQEMCLHVFDTDRMQLTVKVNTGVEAFRALSWSPKGDVFAALFYDTCKIYNSGTGNVEQTIQIQCEYSRLSIAWSVDGTTLCLPTSDYLYFYEVATGKELRRVHFDGVGSEPQALAYSLDGMFLAVGDSYFGISIFKLSTAAFECTRLAKVRGAVSSYDFISPEAASGNMKSFGGVLAMSAHRKELLRKKPKPKKRKLGDAAMFFHSRVIPDSGHVADRGITSLCWSPDGNLLAAGDSAGGVHVWNMATGRIQFASEDIEWTDYYDQDQFAELLQNRGAHQICTQRKRPPTITVPNLNNRSNHLKDGNCRASPCWLSFSSKGDKLYSCNGHVRIWDVANGVSTVHCSAHACCSMSPDSSKLAGFYYDPDGYIEAPPKLLNDDAVDDSVKLCVSNFDGKNDGAQLKKE